MPSIWRFSQVCPPEATTCLYVRENTVLPVGEHKDRADYDYHNGLTLHIFELGDSAKTVIYDKNGKNPATVSIIRNGNNISVKLDKQLKNIKLLLRNIPYTSSVLGGEAESVSLGTLITLDSKEVIITL